MAVAPTSCCAVASRESRSAWFAQKRERWGRTPTEFLTRYNPDVQRLCAVNVERCFTGDAPTLRDARQAYSAEVAESWLDVQLTDLVAFCGVSKDGFADVVVPLIAVISDNFGHLKLSELMLFFQQFKAGKYGRFYGSVDPMVITTALQEFLRFRAERLAVIEREHRRAQQKKQDAERAERAKRGEYLTYEEWEEIRWLYNM